MKKLFAVMLLSAFTFGTLVVSADPSIKTDTTKKEKSKKEKFGVSSRQSLLLRGIHHGRTLKSHSFCANLTHDHLSTANATEPGSSPLMKSQFMKA